MRLARNIAIVALLALAVTAIPGGGDVANAVVTALVMAFLAAIAFAVHRFYREQQFSFMALTDAWRLAVVVAVGAVVLMIVGTDELLGTGFGIFIWLAVIGAAVFTLVRAWAASRSY